MSEITVVATDTQGKTHVFDKPTPFNPANDPFLFGMNRGRTEAARECYQICINRHAYNLAKEIKEKFGLEI